jgi:hypothetical protein
MSVGKKEDSVLTFEDNGSADVPIVEFRVDEIAFRFLNDVLWVHAHSAARIGAMA